MAVVSLRGSWGFTVSFRGSSSCSETKISKSQTLELWGQLGRDKGGISHTSNPWFSWLHTHLEYRLTWDTAPFPDRKAPWKSYHNYTIHGLICHVARQLLEHVKIKLTLVSLVYSRPMRWREVYWVWCITTDPNFKPQQWGSYLENSFHLYRWGIWVSRVFSLLVSHIVKFIIYTCPENLDSFSPITRLPVTKCYTQETEEKLDSAPAMICLLQ